MKTEQLTIEVPKGFKIDSFDEATGVVRFKEITDIRDKVKTFEDACRELNINSGQLKVSYPSSIESGLGKAIIAHARLMIIAKALNEGWEPDWSNDDENKYFPWFDMEDSASGGFSCRDYDDGWTGSHVGSRLCFKSAELAKYAGTQFKDLYEEYFVIK